MSKKYKCLYNTQGKHKRVIKCTSWWNLSQYLVKRFGDDTNNPELKNFIIKQTKS